ncbi:hypothetical protein BKA67DRAFT_691734 [Truncatella angustata]|uniref:Fatty acid hydroxylase domain-containing protein n=1 Tax=Truncatella angustata TaxID=152316 RepID=A0A9P8ZY96_9PEZI|nr:uncharacterized protein BKA67DRAFT_691734 [Truncatella angustata]KAH6654769.1 hypothetical protein BKA67DRAFT_691734 [Truncatella angustata]
MDVVLEVFDSLVLDQLYAKCIPSGTIENGAFSQLNNTSIVLDNARTDQTSAWQRDNIWRQTLTLYMLTWIFGTVLYLICATLSYVFIFDKATLKHPKVLKNQVSLEIKHALASTPYIALLTTPLFLLEVRGYSKLYATMADGPGLWYDIAQFPLVILFTDFGIYWIHRFMHHPRVYKYIHKPHHKWVVPTPYASVAFHPVDGFLQSFPYHLYPFLFPLHRYTYLGLFFFVQIWTVVIHDGEYVSKNEIINGAACHTMHHLYFNYNYGQFTTLWDRIGGSYRRPDEELLALGLAHAGMNKDKNE